MPVNTNAEVDARLESILRSVRENGGSSDTWKFFLANYFSGTPADEAEKLLYAWADRHSLEIQRSMEPRILGGEIEELRIVPTRAPGGDDE
jgi:hypothetical protein